MATPRSELEPDPLWYKDAVVYQLHVRAYHDSNADGIGDFPGLTEKLDYLQDLGVTALWLLPFYPSPLRDDGYDIADYRGVHASYGTPRDVRRFVSEAHRRGMRVITELVMNHTSDRHPWFQRARTSPAGSKHRDFYVWSDTDERYENVRIIFQDFEPSNWTWDEAAGAYYWHRFYHHQPDLNFDNPAVHRAMLRVVDYWFDAGVDGLRLDAVPYLYEREGTSCENLPETHAFLRKLRAHVDQRHESRMLLAEANQWPEDAAEYFGRGDECHMCFHFPLMPRLFMAIHQEDRFPILDILEQTPAIPDAAQWAIFLRNHDELTLEMVTDEERDYMYRMYAQNQRARINLGIRRRLAPLLGNSRRKIELMNGLLFSLPGTPIVYYGDEIGMGDNIWLGDRDGVRTPMQWSSDRCAGFSRANPQRLYLPPIIDPEYHYETVNVQTQLDNTNSLLWWMRRLIALRQQAGIFGTGELRFLTPSNPKVLAFLRTSGEKAILVVANLSRFVQGAELDLSEYRNAVPVEMFGRNRFPPVGDLPYFVTLGPHAFYWFSLERARDVVHVGEGVEDELPHLRAKDAWDEVLAGRRRRALEVLLPGWLQEHRWFGGKSRTVQGTSVLDAPPVPPASDGRERRTEGAARLALVQVDYTEGESETYVVPLAAARGERADDLLKYSPAAALAWVDVEASGERLLLHDAAYDPDFRRDLLETVVRRRNGRGEGGRIVGSAKRGAREPLERGELHQEPRLLGVEQSNTSILFDERWVMKLYRRAYEGPNPDVEVGRFLGERTGFAHTPAVVGTLEYRAAQGEPRTLGILQDFVPNQGDAWRHALDVLSGYLEQALTPHEERSVPAAGIDAASPIDLLDEEMPREATELVGTFLLSAELLGRRTAEMHLALASDARDPAFAVDPMTGLYLRSLYQSMRTLTKSVLSRLRRALPRLDEGVRERARELADAEPRLLAAMAAIRGVKEAGGRIRTHGDYHLGQVLWTGRDFVIIDFEGEPARSLGERRLKRSPLRDVAGMLRSFDYAAHTGLEETAQRFGLGANPDALRELEAYATFWSRWVGVVFLRSWLAAMGDAEVLPRDRATLVAMLRAYLLEKAVYELGYELDNRPTWTAIPLAGILRMLPAEEE